MHRASFYRFGTSFVIGLCGIASISPAAAADEEDVQEIVVTAARREQVVQDVPASVAVIDPQQFSEGGVNNLTGVLAYVPGVIYNDNGAPGQGSITMRGVANIFATPSVGVYVDDIPYGSVTAFAEGANFALDSLLGDVERIEVVKGPQGTLFGASAMGGSLRYITREPSLNEVRGRVSADLSNTTHGDLNQLYRGRLSLPIVKDRLAVSVNGFYQDDGGFIDQATRPEKDVNDAKLHGGQATILWKPIDPFKVKLNYTEQKFKFGNTNAVPFALATGDPVYGRYEESTAGGTPTDINFKLYSGTLEYEASWATATFAASYQKFAQNSILDLTTALGGLVDAQLGDPPGTNTVLLDFDITTNRSVQEFRLTSPNNEHLEWLVGLYHTKENSKNFQGTDVSPGNFDLVTQQFPSRYKEWAGFGNVTYYFTSQFDATVGLRYSSNDMGVIYTGTGLLAGPNLPQTTVSDDVKTYLFNMRYRPNDDLSLYLRVANGYRPASSNLSLVDPGTGEILSVPFVRADTLWSYEVGAKGNLAGGFKYDVAVYQLKWKDLQVFRSFLGASVGGNADSDVTARGLEATLTYAPSRAFDVVGTMTYSRSKLDDDDPSIGGLAGEQLPGIPKWMFSLLGNYHFPLTDSMQGFVGGGISYQDERKSSFNGGTTAGGAVIGPANPNYTAKDYFKADLRAGVTAGRYQVSLYATNLFNKYAYQRATTNAFEGTATILRPRTIGAVASVDF
jgi:outer membrane receptor protein involved in Fe transport